MERGELQKLLRTESLAATATPVPTRESNFRDVTVKVHIRRPEKDSWMYLGRGIASHEVNGHSSRVGE